MTATPRTELDLVKSVMEKSNWIMVGEPISADDADFIKRTYREKLDEIRPEGLAFWPTDSIPLEVFAAMVKLVINEAGSAFGEAYNPQVEEWARRQIRRVISTQPSGEPSRGEYY